jgi:hypothetical protein
MHELHALMTLLSIKYPENLTHTVALGNQTCTRLENRLELDRSKELLLDTFLITKSLLILKFIALYDRNVDFEKYFIAASDNLNEYYTDHPDLKTLTTDDKNTLTRKGNDAVNTITSLNNKYPY